MKKIFFCFFLPSLLFSQTLNLPPRPAGALKGTALISQLTPLSRADRENAVFTEIAAGNIPSFLRRLVPVAVSAQAGGKLRSTKFYATPDYMAIGSDDDYFLIPMTPLLAQKICDLLQCTLPTRKMVNDIYAAAPLKLAPLPIAPTAEMTTVPVFSQHNTMVWGQRSPVLITYPLGALVGGTKKDVIISNNIYNNLKTNVPKPVVIYGWHQLNGSPIQPSYNGHGETYADYSHGIRLIQQAITIDDSTATVSGTLKNSQLYPLLSDEGLIVVPRYTVPVSVGRSSDAAEPDSFILESYPNPFNPATTIRYSVPAPGHATLTIYDTIGREAAVLVNEEKEAGQFSVVFDASAFSSGIYLCRMTAGEHIKTLRIVLER